MKKKIDHYGDGCRSGHFLAQKWLNDPKRGNPKKGGTLQYLIFELAENLKSAADKREVDRARGTIVGFCYAVECPDDAAKCLAAAAG